jgi:predicted phage terminase large subunit-like protein
MGVIKLSRPVDRTGTLKAIEKRRCEMSLAEFVKAAWHIIEPGQEYIHGFHIDFICAHLEAITDGELNDDGTYYNRLLVNVPPGTMKSLLIGVFWPAWEWGPRNMPHMRYVCASHSLDLAIRDSLRMRRLVTSEWYQMHWGDRVQITGDQNAKAKFETVATGFRQACAFTGITGYRGDRVICLPHDAMVLTSEGWLPIGKIVDDQLPVMIAGHNGDSMTWQEIEAYERNAASPLISIRTAEGGFECTGNHLVYVKDKGWIEAEQVCEGDGVYMSPLWKPRGAGEVLHTPVLPGPPAKGHARAQHQAVPEVRDASVPTAVGLEENAEGRVLQPPMRVIGGHQREVDWRTGYIDLSTLPVPVPAVTVGGQEGQVVFPAVCGLVDMGSERSSHPGEALRGVRSDLQAEGQDDLHVFAGLCGKAALKVPARRGEWPLHPRQKQAGIPAGVDAELQGVDPREGREHLSGLRLDGDGADPACASHQLHQRGLGPAEPDHGLQTLSRFDARVVAEPTGMVCQTVTSVERSSRSVDATYNLRVGPNHNYFANGFLLHNCDDPHSVDDANSDAKRETVTTLFKEAVTSRLNNPDRSAIVVVMQRLHEHDVSGVILDNDMGYDHIMLPMRFDPNRACVTRLGYADPREIDGELLFPDRFPEHVVDRDEAAMGPYATAGQYAQSPEPRGGGIVKDVWWKLWDKPEYPPIEFIVASLDTAYTTKSENDPSALTIWGVFSASGEQASTRMVDRYGRPIESATAVQSEALGATAKVMMMYAWQGKLEIGELVVKVEEICTRMRVDLLLIENKAAGHSVAQEIRRVFNSASFAVQMYDPKTLDKVARLYSIQHIFSEGMVYAPNKDWAEMVIRQTSSFPRGAHDDLVDTVSMGLKHLRDVGMLTRAPERLAEIEDSKVFHGNNQDAPLYNA